MCKANNLTKTRHILCVCFSRKEREDSIGEIDLQRWNDASASPVLQIENLILVTPDRKRILINDLTVNLEHGQHLLIVGNSGAGKSSLLRAIAEGTVPMAYGAARGHVSKDTSGLTLSCLRYSKRLACWRLPLAQEMDMQLKVERLSPTGATCCRWASSSV
jgi:ATPase subunit of ABC transporter with duplicated ATPase domains